MTIGSSRLGVSVGMATFVVAYLTAELLPVLLVFSIAGTHFGDFWSNHQVVQLRLDFRRLVLLAACICYGVGRWTAHPLLNPPHLAWLRTTPWTSRLPLPLGPGHLVWSDLVKLAVLGTLTSWDAEMNPAWVVVVFGGAFLIVGMLALAQYSKPEAVLLAFGFGGLRLAFPAVSVMAIIVGLMYGVFYIGHERCLRRLTRLEIGPKLALPKSTDDSLGWPFGAIGPARKMWSVTYTTAIVTAALLGWWAFCLGFPAEQDRLNVGMKYYADDLALATALVVGIGRLLVYCIECQPPISLWGRLWTGRWVIPGYDYVLLAPIVAAGVPLVVANVGDRLPVPQSIVAGVVVGAGVLLGLAAGPSVRRWRLTGEHRLVVTRTNHRPGQRAAARPPFSPAVTSR